MGESRQASYSSLLSQIIEIHTHRNGWIHTMETIESSKSIHSSATPLHLPLNDCTRSLKCDVEAEKSPSITAKASWADMAEDSE